MMKCSKYIFYTTRNNHSNMPSAPKNRNLQTDINYGVLFKCRHQYCDCRDCHQRIHRALQKRLVPPSILFPPQLCFELMQLGN